MVSLLLREELAVRTKDAGKVLGFQCSVGLLGSRRSGVGGDGGGFQLGGLLGVGRGIG